MLANDFYRFTKNILERYNDLGETVTISDNVELKLGDKKVIVKLEDIFQFVSAAIVEGTFQMDIIDIEIWDKEEKIRELKNQIEVMTEGYDEL